MARRRSRVTSSCSLSPAGESDQAGFEDPTGDRVHLRLRAQADDGDHGGGLALYRSEDHLATTPHPAVGGAAAPPSDPLAFGGLESLPGLHDGGLNLRGAPSVGVLADTT